MVHKVQNLTENYLRTFECGIFINPNIKKSYILGMSRSTFIDNCFAYLPSDLSSKFPMLKVV